MDFKLFEEVYMSEAVENPITTTTPEECQHPRILMENSHKICENCGILMNKDLSFEKEWRFYGLNDTKHHNDPNRCHLRKIEEVSIFKDVDKLGFSEKIILYANSIYEEVTQKKIYRGNSRRGIIFACIFHAYKMNDLPQSCESLIKVFGIERKIALKGLKYVNLNASKNSVFRHHYISPEDLINEIMDKFYATPDQKQEVLELYKQIENKSSLLNRSRPQSVSSGVVRYYILKKEKDVPMSVFKSKVNLSELTINRIVKEIERIIEQEDQKI
jgi:transcription initiation factor TFIIIB Brf1 subunit/transcription initiation factor TFIIB